MGEGHTSLVGLLRAIFEPRLSWHIIRAMPDLPRHRPERRGLHTTERRAAVDDRLGFDTRFLHNRRRRYLRDSPRTYENRTCHKRLGDELPLRAGSCTIGPSASRTAGCGSSAQ